MNLLKDSWLPVIRQDGTREKVAICGLLDGYESNPIVDLEAPRPDFRNAIYQLLIGIVQVAAAPEDEEEWAELWEEPYSAEEFERKVLEYEHCFEIDSEGPAFMQDYDAELVKKSSPVSIFRLLIGSPSDNAVDQNKDLFVKESNGYELDAYWAAIALYATQTTGRPDGPGCRAGLQGTGPLIALLVPHSDSGRATFWQKLWLNVFPQDDTSIWKGNCDKAIFPWMTHTISSENDTMVRYDDLHPLSVYWGMPWRTRFVLPTQEGVCHLTGEDSPRTITCFRRMKHGNLYSNLWRNPFSPYRTQIKDKGKQGNGKLAMLATSDRFSYRAWGVLCFGDKQFNRCRIVDYFMETRSRYFMAGGTSPIRLWVCGFHMDKAKAMSWNEALMPLLSIHKGARQKVSERIEVFTTQSSELARALEKAIKTAWFPLQKKGLQKKGPQKKHDVSFLSTAFWENTELDFYRLLDRMMKVVDDARAWADCAKEWRDRITREALDLFDTWALAQQEEGLNMRRIVNAHGALRRSVQKVNKELNNYIEIE